MMQSFISQPKKQVIFFPLLWGLCTVPVWALYSQIRNISQNAVISLWRTQGYTNKHSWPRGSSVSEFRLSADIPNDLSQNYNTKRWGGAGQSAAHRRGSSTGIYSLHTSSFSSWARQKSAETWLHLPGAVSAVVHTDNVRAKVLFVGGSQPQENAQPMELGKAGQQLQKSQSTCTHPPPSPCSKSTSGHWLGI